ncbi:hypothetical protein GGX14DRAFT_556057 [Mycena pura]|uniref:Uncharacterized protein n=1 Tax=Mycena pura TaxID=153505 RepID=A0AAD6YNU6_9AGAR|nr:hypothetical protein GGX14DRAFT_556057 [Mycena pura]
MEPTARGLTQAGARPRLMLKRRGPLRWRSWEASPEDVIRKAGRGRPPLANRPSSGIDAELDRVAQPVLSLPTLFSSRLAFRSPRTVAINTALTRTRGIDLPWVLVRYPVLTPYNVREQKRSLDSLEPARTG